MLNAGTGFVPVPFFTTKLHLHMLLNEVEQYQRFVFVDPKLLLRLDKGTHSARGVFELLSVLENGYLLDFEGNDCPVLKVHIDMGTRAVLLVN
jgi:hypothetical protein